MEEAFFCCVAGGDGRWGVGGGDCKYIRLLVVLPEMGWGVGGGAGEIPIMDQAVFVVLPERGGEGEGTGV